MGGKRERKKPREVGDERDRSGRKKDDKKGKENARSGGGKGDKRISKVVRSKRIRKNQAPLLSTNDFCVKG